MRYLIERGNALGSGPHHVKLALRMLLTQGQFSVRHARSYQACKITSMMMSFDSLNIQQGPDQSIFDYHG